MGHIMKWMCDGSISWIEDDGCKSKKSDKKKYKRIIKMKKPLNMSTVKNRTMLNRKDDA